MYKMGERASAGKLVYNVLEAEWKKSLGDGIGERVPEHRFLVVRLSVANSGTEAVNLPLLTMLAPNGTSYRELENGDKVDNWLGLLRPVGPAANLAGQIVFDAPPAAYKLQITDAAPEIENEITAFVDLPLNMDSDPVITEPPAIPAPKK